MEPVYYAYIAFVAILLLATIARSVPTIQQIIRIWRIRTDYISALPSDGLVEVVGKTEHKTIKSPLKDSDCVWWQVSVEQGISGSRRDDLWIEIYNNKSKEPFYINDGTGKIQILPDGAQYTLRTEVNRSSNPGILSFLDTRTKEALNKLGIPAVDQRKIQVYVWIILPEEQIYVQGNIKFMNGIKSLVSEEGIPLIISDRSEQLLLVSLYWRIFIRNLLPIIIIISIVFLAIYAR